MSLPPLYPEHFIAPMRQELVALGVEEMRTPEEVDARLGARQGTALVVINSMCGCAARNARPAVAIALRDAKKRPDLLTTVFAGQDRDATERARAYFTGWPPSSPSIGILKDGEPVFMLERHRIEGRRAEDIAADLIAAFEQFC